MINGRKQMIKVINITPSFMYRYRDNLCESYFEKHVSKPSSFRHSCDLPPVFSLQHLILFKSWVECPEKEVYCCSLYSPAPVWIAMTRRRPLTWSSPIPHHLPSAIDIWMILSPRFFQSLQKKPGNIHNNSFSMFCGQFWLYWGRY